MFQWAAFIRKIDDICKGWKKEKDSYYNILIRLQHSPYFCVFKYARAVKQKVWNEAENRERVRPLRQALPISLLILRKKLDCFCSLHIDKKLNSRSCAKTKYTCQGRCVPRKKFYPRKRGITTQVDFRTVQSTHKGRTLTWVKEGHDWSRACKQ